MALLGRIAWFMTRMAFALLVEVLRLLVRILLPVAFEILSRAFGLMRMAFAATVNGPVQYSGRLASDWTRRLIGLGVSRDHMDVAFLFCRFIVASEIVLGWALAALFTVAILRIVFGIFF